MTERASIVFYNYPVEVRLNTHAAHAEGQVFPGRKYRVKS
jgi:hypothetical protein